MTSIAFIAGVFPLVIARGAGSEMRQAMGVAVFAGMIGVTLFGLFLTPVFYVTSDEAGVEEKAHPRTGIERPRPRRRGSNGRSRAIALLLTVSSTDAGVTDRGDRTTSNRRFSPGKLQGPWNSVRGREGRRSTICEGKLGGKYSATAP
jgi:hypothetical protein